MLLIFGQKEDNHIIRVERLLLAGGRTQYLRIDRYMCPMFSMEGRTLTIDSNEIHLLSCYAWWRLKVPFSGDAYLPEDSIEQTHYYAEWHKIHERISKLIPSGQQFPVLCDQSRFNNKLNQLEIAQSVGFMTPKTIVSSNVDSVVTAMPEDRFVVKQLSPAPAGEKGPLLTTLIDSKRLRELESSVSNCPTLFQEYIDRKFELRVHVFGETVLTAKLLRPPTEYQKTDWRLATLAGATYEACELSDGTQEKILKLAKSLGLKFCIADLCMSLNNQLIFLEVNPYGQYTFIEDQTGLPLSEAMAGLIMNTMED